MAEREGATAGRTAHTAPEPAARVRPRRLRADLRADRALPGHRALPRLDDGRDRRLGGLERPRTGCLAIRRYPFIFLTLVLSLQASYAAPLILLAQNRQDDRDRVNLEQDRKRDERSIADTEYLTREIASLRMGLGEVATRDWIRSELRNWSRSWRDGSGDGRRRVSGENAAAGGRDEDDR